MQEDGKESCVPRLEDCSLPDDLSHIAVFEGVGCRLLGLDFSVVICSERAGGPHTGLV